MDHLGAPRALVAEPEPESAHSRFKRSWGNWFWGSMILATMVHVAVFSYWPELTAEDFSFVTDELEAIELPPEIEIPPPPAQVPRPAIPVVATTEIDEDITISPTTFEENPVEKLPPPPEAKEVGTIEERLPFTPFTQAPKLLNGGEIEREMERLYPPLLRDAGIGGTVRVAFYIDENGRVQDKRLGNTSGHTALDEAALAVALKCIFSPAKNRDKVVPVWVEFPITFQVR